MTDGVRCVIGAETFFCASISTDGSVGPRSAGAGLRHRWQSERRLLLPGAGGDDAGANCVTTLLCPHLDGSKKNGDNKKGETGTSISYVFSGELQD